MIIDPVLPLGLVVVMTVAMAVFAAWRARVTRSAARVGWLLRGAMILLLCVIALRPSIPGSSVGPTATGGLEVYFVVDTTSSMAAEDISPGAVPPEPANGDDRESEPRPPTRLDAAKADVARMTAALPGAQFSLTTFDATTVQRVPLTSDVTALESAVRAMTQEVTFYSHGSTIDAPLVFMAELLATAQEEHPDRRRVMFYLGDGEQTRAEEPRSFDAIAPYIGGGAVLGYGTADGGVMREFDGFDVPSRFGQDESDSPSYIQDPVTGENALSRIDEAALGALASQLQVRYHSRTSGGGVDEVIAAIDVEAVGVRPGSVDGPVEFYWIFAIPLGLLALRELLSVGRSLLAVRPATGGTT